MSLYEILNKRHLPPNRCKQWRILVYFSAYTLGICLILAVLSRNYDFHYFDDSFIVLIPPLFYIALITTRSVYIACTLLAYVGASATLYFCISTPFDNIRMVTFIVLSILVAQEIIHRTLDRQKKLQQQVEELANQLQASLDKIKTLSELLPICSVCNKLQTDEEAWADLEAFLRRELHADILKGICPDCTKEMVQNLTIKADLE